MHSNVNTAPPFVAVPPKFYCPPPQTVATLYSVGDVYSSQQLLQRLFKCHPITNAYIACMNVDYVCDYNKYKSTTAEELAGDAG